MITPKRFVSFRCATQLASLSAVALTLALTGCATEKFKVQSGPRVVCHPTGDAFPIPSTYFIVPFGSKEIDVLATVTTDSNVPKNCSPQSTLLGGWVTLKATQSGKPTAISQPSCLAAWNGTGQHSQLVPVHLSVSAEGTWAIAKNQVKPWWTQADMNGDPACHRILYVSTKKDQQLVDKARPEVRFSLSNFYDAELQDVKARLTTGHNQRVLAQVSLPSIPQRGRVHPAITIKGPLPPVGTKFTGVISGQAKLHGQVIKGSTSVRLEVTDRKPWHPIFW